MVWVEEGEEGRILGWKERKGEREGKWRLMTAAEEEEEDEKEEQEEEKGNDGGCRFEVVRHEWMGEKRRGERRGASAVKGT